MKSQSATNLTPFTKAIPVFIEDWKRFDRIHSDKTAEHFKQVLGQFARHLGQPHVEPVTRRHVEAWFDQNPHWSSATKKAYRNRVHSFYAWASIELSGESLYNESRPLVEKNPVAELRARTLKSWGQKTKQHNWLTVEQINRVLSGCQPTQTQVGRRDHALISTAYLSGLRVSELVSLRWGSINWDGRVFFVVGKGSKVVEQPIDTEVHEVLRDWRLFTAEQLGRLPKASDPLWPRATPLLGATPRDERGRVLSGSSGTSLDWTKALGISGAREAVAKRGAVLEGLRNGRLSPHDLRRSYTKLLQDNGFDVQQISHLLRHTSLQTTQTYLADNRLEAIKVGRNLGVKLAR